MTVFAIPDTAETVVRASHVPGPRQGSWTYDDYAVLADDGYRYEIIDGVLYMAPAPIPEHEHSAALIIGRFIATVEDANRGYVMVSPDIDLGSIVLRPDVVVVLNDNRSIIGSKKLVGPPDLVVEVASPSTAAYDRDEEYGKRGAYARGGVREYWIADPGTKSIEVLVLDGERYRSLGVFAGEQSPASEILPELSFSVRSCFPRS